MTNSSTTFDIPIIAAVLLLTMLAMYTDYRKRIIANSLTLPAIALGLIMNLLGNGWQGIILSLLGLAAGIGILLIPYIFGQMGGGDVKLMGAIGAFLGFSSVLNIALYTGVAGGVLAIAYATLNKSLIVSIRKVWLLIKCVLLFRSPATGSVLLQSRIGIPYGLAIGAGTMCYLIIGKIV